MRLTAKQRALMDELMDEQEICADSGEFPHYECFPEEARTVRALEQKELVNVIWYRDGTSQVQAKGSPHAKSEG